MIRIGTGYDVHALKKGRRLILGGVCIPFDLGLDGHSDADVLVHAVMDALFGAAALGDIGQHFPDNETAYLDADSIVLLNKCRMLLESSGYRPVNIDSTIICQAPKLQSYIPEMRKNIAAALGLDVSLVSVKATTEEHLGFTGQGLGIAADAVCIIENI